MMRRVCLAMVFLAGAVPAAPSLAQVVAGDSVRLRAAGREIAQGRFLGADSSAVMLLHLPAGDTLRVGRETFNRAERLHRGSSAARTVLGGLFGTGVGLLAGGGGSLPTLAAATGLGVVGAVAAEITGAGGAEWRYVPVGDLGAERAIAPPADRLLLATGDTVKVFDVSDELAHGILTLLDSTAMRVESFDGAVSAAVPRSRIVRIDVLRGRPRRGMAAVAEGMLIGGAAGLLAGRLLSGGGTTREDGGLAMLVVGTAGLLAGTVGGAIVGVTRIERWIPVDPHTCSLLEAP